MPIAECQIQIEETDKGLAVRLTMTPESEGSLALALAQALYAKSEEIIRDMASSSSGQEHSHAH
jgi:hypothetical protein